jgi:hypothetical protein
MNSNQAAWVASVREQRYRRSADLWEGGIKKNIGKKYFNVIQFISCELDEEYGSDWQKLVCQELAVPEEECERFWNEVGKRTARKTINTRRQNTTLAMKKRFKGKWIFCWLGCVCVS